MTTSWDEVTDFGDERLRQAAQSQPLSGRWRRTLARECPAAVDVLVEAGLLSTETEFEAALNQVARELEDCPPSPARVLGERLLELVRAMPDPTNAVGGWAYLSILRAPLTTQLVDLVGKPDQSDREVLEQGTDLGVMPQDKLGDVRLRGSGDDAGDVIVPTALEGELDSGEVAEDQVAGHGAAPEASVGVRTSEGTSVAGSPDPAAPSLEGRGGDPTRAAAPEGDLP